MFRFTIRDVLLLTAVVALAMGWLIDHQSTSYRLREAVNNQAKLANCANLLRETIECLEAEGYIWSTSSNRVYLKRDPRSLPKTSK
jgi:hypothetical protein